MGRKESNQTNKQWLVMMCRIKTKVSDCQYDLVVKGQVTHAKNLSMAQNANTTFSFWPSVYIFATIIVYHV